MRNLSSSGYQVIVAAVLFLHAVLLAWSGLQHSPTHLELFHLAAGVSHLEVGKYDLFRVNPPLVRTVAALPLVAVNKNIDWESYDGDPSLRSEYVVGLDFMYANGSRSLWLTTIARWACIPFSILGGWICCRWSQHLYGRIAGIFALVLWAFCPYILGHAALITPDAHAAAMGVASAFAFWLWLKAPTISRTVVAGLTLGLAELAKLTLVVFYFLWPLVWFVNRLLTRRPIGVRQWLYESTLLASLLAFSLVVINLGYGFEKSFWQLKDFQFQSEILVDSDERSGGNRFNGSWAGYIPVPLPANYLQGIDRQTYQLERGEWSYLRGKWQVGGWWYFFAYAMAIKIPLGFWALLIIALVVRLPSAWGEGARDELILFACAGTLLFILSTQNGIGLHSRYAIPILPFFFVYASKAAVYISERRRVMGTLAAFCLSWYVASSLFCYPHSLSYFNELIGGPRNGFLHLAKSDTSWGQDLSFLQNYCRRHDIPHLHLASCGPLDPRIFGLEFSIPSAGPRSRYSRSAGPSADRGPKPGWYAIDVNFLPGNDPLSAADGHGGWEEPAEVPGFDLSYFRRFVPDAMVGYSFRVYYITAEEANNVRRELGLPPVTSHGKKERAWPESISGM